MVADCAMGTDVCHWMFKKRVNMVQSQQDGPLTGWWGSNLHTSNAENSVNPTWEVVKLGDGGH